MEQGCLPILPPARRDFTRAQSITLPYGNSVVCWPPVGWEKMGASQRYQASLLLTVNLEMRVGHECDPTVDPNMLLAQYNMLVMSGVRIPAAEDQALPGLVRAQSGMYQHIRELAVQDQINNTNVPILLMAP